MWSTIWHTFFFDPIYNVLVFFVDVIPGGDVGLAIIAATILVKLFLLPLSVKAAKTQVIMRELEPELKALKEKHKDDREEQAKAMMLLYKDAGLNPFASIFLIFLQIPIIISLYLSVSNGGGVPLPAINTDLLFSFISEPVAITMVFIGLIDIAARNIPLALLAAVTQYFQAKLTLPTPAPKEEGAAPDFKADFQRSMSVQMRYVLPLIIFFVAYTFSASIALYFCVSNLFAIAQELYIKRHRSPGHLE